MCVSFGCCRGSHVFVCFDCRRTAKGSYRQSGFARNDPHLTQKTESPRCPTCRRVMRDCGLSAKPPRRHHVARWAAFEDKYAEGR